MSAPAPRPVPLPGQSWTVGAALLDLLADTPVTVTELRAGVVHYRTASGVPMTMPLGVYRGLYQPAGPPR